MARISLRETFGLKPLLPAAREAWNAVRGDPYSPPNLWGPSSLQIFKPSVSVQTWLRKARRDKKAPIYNFFNRVRPPKDRGYSVRVTYARDFLGGNWTYDGHNGTDFAIPVGTVVVAAAPGLVLRVHNDFRQGGLKVCIDHGEGLFTTSSHLARALVAEGDRVKRGQPVGLSGASGMEFVLFFPWVAPHLHYNVWLNGEPVDPFAQPDTDGASMWRSYNDPVPFDDDPADEDSSFEPSQWDAEAVADAITACRDPRFRSMASSFPALERRAAEVMFTRNYRPAMFDAFPRLYRTEGQRRPVLDLPFLRQDFVGAAFPAHATAQARGVRG